MQFLSSVIWRCRAIPELVASTWTTVFAATLVHLATPVPWSKVLESSMPEWIDSAAQTLTSALTDVTVAVFPIHAVSTPRFVFVCFFIVISNWIKYTNTNFIIQRVRSNVAIVWRDFSETKSSDVKTHLECAPTVLDATSMLIARRWEARAITDAK